MRPRSDGLNEVGHLSQIVLRWMPDYQVAAQDQAPQRRLPWRAGVALKQVQCLGENREGGVERAVQAPQELGALRVSVVVPIGRR